MSIQSLMTPAMFIVSALVFPISRKTDMLRAKAAAALLKKIGMSNFTCTDTEDDTDDRAAELLQL